MVVTARSSVAKRTNRHRLHADTAQKMCTPASVPQSMINVSPGDHTPGRRPAMVLRTPRRLGLGHQPTEVAPRSLIARGARHRQHTLRRDTTLGLLHPSATTSATTS
jgi:hypothetical protein